MLNKPCPSPHGTFGTVFAVAALILSHQWCWPQVHAPDPQRVPGANAALWRVIKSKDFGRVTALAFAPDSRTLAVGTWAIGTWASRQSLSLWDVQTGKLLRTLQGEGNRISAVSFSPDGKLLASGDDLFKGPGTVTIWNVATGRAMRSLRAGGPLWVRFVGFAPDNKTLVTGWYAGAMQTYHFDLKRVPSQDKSSHTQRYTGPGEVKERWGDLDFPCEVRLWDVQTGALRSRFKIEELESMAYVPGVAVTMESDIMVRDIHSGKERRQLRDWGAQILALSPDSKQLAAGSSNQRIRLWDLTSGKELPRIQIPGWMVEAVAFSPDGRILAGGTRNRDKPNDDLPGHVFLWSARTRKPLRVLKGHSDYVNTLAFSPNGKLLASGSSEEVRLWHIK